MKIKAFVGKICPVNEYENIKGKWRSLDVVLRNEETITYPEGGTGKVLELLAIRIRGEKIDDFLRDVKPGMQIEAVVRPMCDEKTTKDLSRRYLQNDMVFSCPEWRII